MSGPQPFLSLGTFDTIAAEDLHAPAWLHDRESEPLALMDWCRDVIKQALIVAADSSDIDCEHLLLHQSSNGQMDAASSTLNRTDSDLGSQAFLLIKGEPTLDVIQREYLGTLLLKYRGNRRLVADALGVSERTACGMLSRHGFRNAADVDPSHPVP